MRARLAALDHPDADPGSLDAAFGEAIAALRAANSPYDLAHGLLDLAEYLAGRGAPVTSVLAEVTDLNATLRVPAITRRVDALRARGAVPGGTAPTATTARAVAAGVDGRPLT